MQNALSEGELLKVDRRGHVRVPAKRREALLDEFERCGVSAVQFAASIGVKYHTFAHWRQVRERKRQASEVAAPSTPVALLPEGSRSGIRWVEAVVDSHEGKVATKPALKIALPGGAHLEIADAGEVPLAAELLRALESKGRVTC